MPGPKTNLQDMLERLSSSSSASIVSPSATTNEGQTISAPKFTLSRAATATPKVSTKGSNTSSNVSRPSSSNRIVLVPSTEAVGPAKLASPAALTTASPLSTMLTPSGWITGEGSEAGPSRPPLINRSAPTSRYDTMPVEKIQAMIIKNHEELFKLYEQQTLLQTSDDMIDWDGEDPEMIKGKIDLLTKRNLELKGIVASRNNEPTPVARPSPRPSTVTGPSRALLAYPTPCTTHQPSPALLGLATNDLHTSSEGPSTPSRMALQPRNRPASREFEPPPPAYTDLIADAEAFSAVDNEYLIPASSPPARNQTQRSTTRARPSRGVLQTPTKVLEDDPFDEFQDIHADELFDLPTSPARPVRTEQSAPKAIQSQNAQAGPSGSKRSSVQVQAPKAVKIDVKYPWDKEVTSKLKTYFNIPTFREKQKEAIDATMSGKDVFVLMPTGGGKSLTYQLPGVCNNGKTRGVTFVISPLISLINDQTRHLCKLSVPAIAYTGELCQKDKKMAHDMLNMPEPYTKIVYVTPEMMVMGGTIKGILKGLLRRNRLARFVVDEAHCVSQWGHDFRADYLKLGELRKEYPGIPIMALTATAQDKVQDDIIRSLGIKGCHKITTSFNRRNLHYEVRPKAKGVIDNMVAFIGTQGAKSSGIIYCSSRDKCENLAKNLRDNHGLGANHYHAGMSKGDRRKIQEGWQEHEFEIIVATIAFGMGIDKPDVRYVIHHSLPRSLEGYYQETGRAGRDGKPSHCILYYTFGDHQKVVHMVEQDKNSTREQKQRSKDSLDEVLAFCQNKSDCRRTQVLAFFGEDFDRAKCNKGCDTCLVHDKTTWNKEDVTEDAKIIIKMVQAFDRNDRITVKGAADCFRGYGGNSAKGLGDNPMFGQGKSWDRNDAERLIQTLLAQKALDQFIVANGAGWSNSYLTLGRNAQLFLREARTLKMEFREASPRKQVKAAKRKSDQHGISSFMNKNPIARQRSLQQIAREEQEFDNSHWGDTDDEDYAPSDGAPGTGDDPIEVDTERDEDGDDDVPLAVRKKRKLSVKAPESSNKSRLKARGTARTTGASLTKQKASGSMASKAKAKTVLDILRTKGNEHEFVDRSFSGTPHQQCRKELWMMKTIHARMDRHAPALDSLSIDLIAAMLPTSLAALGKIEGITSAHVKTYGAKILEICLKHSGEPLPVSESRVSVMKPLRQTMSNIQSYAFQPKTTPSGGKSASDGMSQTKADNGDAGYSAVRAAEHGTIAKTSSSGTGSMIIARTGAAVARTRF
ncbi:hypothetical protein BD324DRAFT_605080 [Kockovaella imperatae]|uniref:DNA 3'-5' helicase n=1 Tax=Kockovaella imperatae TaxID=4999 RepID=A0A1Y1U888_9TREE|nr:hypothetical protein BD324DRAFT_605080 [Kockovaella imperatae]ORX34249.1 hypothetical protein BD324DRAFT_605080 [Kockovaella imperatae]